MKFSKLNLFHYSPGIAILVSGILNCRVEGSAKIQYRLEQQQQQQVWNPPRTSNLERHSPSSLMDDIERGKT